jgi:hypothetical protein
VIGAPNEPLSGRSFQNEDSGFNVVIVNLSFHEEIKRSHINLDNEEKDDSRSIPDTFRGRATKSRRGAMV